ncbi:hypothetical protein ABIE52_006860 [Rhodococcus sp. OAS809]
MSRHHRFAHLGTDTAASLFRSLADQTEAGGHGVRILAWRRFAIILKTDNPPDGSAAVDFTATAEDLE